jgi:hypothetical protein
MLDEAFKKKAEHLLNIANADPDGYIGKLTPEQKPILDRFRDMVYSKVPNFSLPFNPSHIVE